MLITKIKHCSKVKKGKKGGSDRVVNHVIIEFKEDNKEVVLHEYDKPSRPARATPEFYQIFDDLRVFVNDICEFQESDIVKISVKGISLSYMEATKNSNEKTGVIFNSSKELVNGSSDLHFCTPLRYDEHPDVGQMLPENSFKVIEDLIALAERYVNGERAQCEMDLKPQSPEGEEQIPEPADENDND